MAWTQLNRSIPATTNPKNVTAIDKRPIIPKPTQSPKLNSP